MTQPNKKNAVKCVTLGVCWVLWFLTLVAISIVTVVNAQWLLYEWVENTTEVVGSVTFVNPEDQSEWVQDISLQDKWWQTTVVISSDNPIVSQPFTDNTMGETNITAGYSQILGWQDITIGSDNITIVWWQWNTVGGWNDNASILWWVWNEISQTTNSWTPAVMVWWEWNTIGSNQWWVVIIWWSQNVIGNNVTNSQILWWSENTVNASNTTVAGSQVNTSAGNSFIFSDWDETFNPQTSNAFYINTANGLWLNAETTEWSNAIVSKWWVSVSSLASDFECDNNNVWVQWLYTNGCLVWCTQLSANDNKKLDLLDNSQDCIDWCKNNPSLCREPEELPIADMPSYCEWTVDLTIMKQCPNLSATDYSNSSFQVSIVGVCPRTAAEASNPCTYVCDEDQWYSYSDTDNSCHKNCTHKWQTIRHGDGIRIYLKQSETCPQTCIEWRDFISYTCDEGNLWITDSNHLLAPYTSCETHDSVQCSSDFNLDSQDDEGWNYESCTSYIAWQNSCIASVKYKLTWCKSGYTYDAAAGRCYADCDFNGTKVPYGQTVIWYAAQTVGCEIWGEATYCDSMVLTCQANGSFGQVANSYPYASCDLVAYLRKDHHTDGNAYFNLEECPKARAESGNRPDGVAEGTLVWNCTTFDEYTLQNKQCKKKTRYHLDSCKPWYTKFGDECRANCIVPWKTENLTYLTNSAKWATESIAYNAEIKWYRTNAQTCPEVKIWNTTYDSSHWWLDWCENTNNWTMMKCNANWVLANSSTYIYQSCTTNPVPNKTWFNRLTPVAHSIYEVFQPYSVIENGADKNKCHVDAKTYKCTECESWYTINKQDSNGQIDYSALIAWNASAQCLQDCTFNISPSGTKTLSGFSESVNSSVWVYNASSYLCPTAYNANTSRETWSCNNGTISRSRNLIALNGKPYLTYTQTAMRPDPVEVNDKNQDGSMNQHWTRTVVRNAGQTHGISNVVAVNVSSEINISPYTTYFPYYDTWVDPACTLSKTYYYLKCKADTNTTDKDKDNSYVWSTNSEKCVRCEWDITALWVRNDNGKFPTTDSITFCYSADTSATCSFSCQDGTYWKRSSDWAYHECANPSQKWDCVHWYCDIDGGNDKKIHNTTMTVYKPSANPICNTECEAITAICRYGKWMKKNGNTITTTEVTDPYSTCATRDGCVIWTNAPTAWACGITDPWVCKWNKLFTDTNYAAITASETPAWYTAWQATLVQHGKEYIQNTSNNKQCTLTHNYYTWNCTTPNHWEKIGGVFKCVNDTKSVPCTTEWKPANSTYDSYNVNVTWNSSCGWNKAENCTWKCDIKYYRLNNSSCPICVAWYYCPWNETINNCGKNKYCPQWSSSPTACPGNMVTDGVNSTKKTDCKITCNAWYYLKAWESACTQCPEWSFCGWWTYNYSDSANQWITACTSLWSNYKYSAAWSSVNTACYMSVAAWSYKTGENANTTQWCGAWKYSGAHNSYYGSADNTCAEITAWCYGTSASTACPAKCQTRAQYSAKWASQCTSVTAWYYTTWCGTDWNGCTWQTQCEANNYCKDGIKYACTSLWSLYTKSPKWSSRAGDCYMEVPAWDYLPEPEVNYTSKCPAGRYSLKHNRTYWTSDKYYASVANTYCYGIEAWCRWAEGATSSCPNTCQTRAKYAVGWTDTTKWSAWSCSTAELWQYTTGCDGNWNGCKWVSSCSVGNYCVNGISYGCPDWYTSNTSTKSLTGCYITVSSAWKCINTPGSASIQDCPAGTYSSSSHQVFYAVGDLISNGLPGKSQPGTCQAGYYCPAGSTSATQKQCPSGYTSAAWAGQISDCKITCNAWTYLPKWASACATCPAWSYCIDKQTTFSYNASIDQGIWSCSSLCSTYTSDAWAAGSSKCYVRVDQWYYKTSSTWCSVAACKDKGGTNQTTNQWSNNHKSYYGSSDSCSACPSWYSCPSWIICGWDTGTLACKKDCSSTACGTKHHGETCTTYAASSVECTSTSTTCAATTSTCNNGSWSVEPKAYSTCTLTATANASTYLKSCPSKCGCNSFNIYKVTTTSNAQSCAVDTSFTNGLWYKITSSEAWYYINSGRTACPVCDNWYYCLNSQRYKCPEWSTSFGGAQWLGNCYQQVPAWSYKDTILTGNFKSCPTWTYSEEKRKSVLSGDKLQSGLNPDEAVLSGSLAPNTLGGWVNYYYSTECRDCKAISNVTNSYRFTSYWRAYEGTNSCPFECAAWYKYDWTNRTCTKCAAWTTTNGWNQSASCSTCSNTTWVSTFSELCTVSTCKAWYYKNGNACSPCAAWYYTNENNTDTSCKICPSWYYCDGVIHECPVGKASAQWASSCTVDCNNGGVGVYSYTTKWQVVNNRWETNCDFTCQALYFKNKNAYYDGATSPYWWACTRCPNWTTGTTDWNIASSCEPCPLGEGMYDFNGRKGSQCTAFTCKQWYYKTSISASWRCELCPYVNAELYTRVKSRLQQWLGVYGVYWSVDWNDALSDGYNEHDQKTSACSMIVPAWFYKTDPYGTGFTACPAGTYYGEHVSKYGSWDYASRCNDYKCTAIANSVWTSTWSTATNCGFKCNPWYAYNGTARTCTACGVWYYLSQTDVDQRKTSCTLCTGWKTTSWTWKSSCDTTCSNAAWVATWDNSDVCKIDTCKPWYFYDWSTCEACGEWIYCPWGKAGYEICPEWSYCPAKSSAPIACSTLNPRQFAWRTNWTGKTKSSDCQFYVDPWACTLPHSYYTSSEMYTGQCANGTYSQGYRTTFNGSGSYYSAPSCTAIANMYEWTGNGRSADTCAFNCKAWYYYNWTARTCTACPTWYTTPDGNQLTSCGSTVSRTCAAGKYLPKNSVTCADCPAGYYCPGWTYSYNPSGPQWIQWCPSWSYCPAKSSSPKACSSLNSRQFAWRTPPDYISSSSDCQLYVDPGSRLRPSARNNPSEMYTGDCENGTWSPGYRTNWLNGSGTECSSCTAITGGGFKRWISPWTADNCDFTCKQWYWWSSSRTCTACSVWYYYPDDDHKSSCIMCTGWKTTSWTWKTSCDATCSNAAWVKTWDNTAVCKVSTCQAWYYKDASNNKCILCASVSSYQWKTTSDGNTSTSCTTACSNSNYWVRSWSSTATCTVSTCKEAYYKDGNACKSCADLYPKWWFNWRTPSYGMTSSSSCEFYIDIGVCFWPSAWTSPSQISTWNCANGKWSPWFWAPLVGSGFAWYDCTPIANMKNWTSGWGSETGCGFNCKAGYKYNVNDRTCTACDVWYYISADGHTTTSCTMCTGWKTTSWTWKTSCDANCSNATWVRTWSSSAVCTVSTCEAWYFKDGNKCTSCSSLNTRDFAWRTPSYAMTNASQCEFMVDACTYVLPSAWNNPSQMYTGRCENGTYSPVYRTNLNGSGTSCGTCTAIANMYSWTSCGSAANNCGFTCKAWYKYDWTARTCTACPAWYTTSDGNQSTSCGTAVWVTCAAGKYLPKSSTSCSNCAGWSYCQGWTFTYSATEDHWLTPCPEWYYCPAGSSSPIPCTNIAHTFTYSPAWSSSQTQCWMYVPAWQYKNNTLSGTTSCSAWTYTWAYRINYGNYNTSCNYNCTAISVAAGFHSWTSGGSTENDCAFKCKSWYYQSWRYCIKCNNGEYTSDGNTASSCGACTEISHRYSWTSAWSAANNCGFTCSAWYYQSWRECKLCAAWKTTSNGNTASSCSACSNNTWVNSWVSGCTISSCKAWYYHDWNKCESCPAWTTSQVWAESLWDCYQVISAWYYKNSGPYLTGYTECPNGQYTLEHTVSFLSGGENYCWDCDAITNRYSWLSRGTSSDSCNFSCSAGTYKSWRQCNLCAGWYTSSNGNTASSCTTACSNSTWVKTWSSGCSISTCSAWYYKNWNNCTLCASISSYQWKTTSDGNTSTSCTTACSNATWVSTWSSTETCTVATCQSWYTKSGNACVANPTNNGCSAPCGTASHNSSLTCYKKNNAYCPDTCSANAQTRTCNNGHWYNGSVASDFGSDYKYARCDGHGKDSCSTGGYPAAPWAWSGVVTASCTLYSYSNGTCSAYQKTDVVGCLSGWALWTWSYNWTAVAACTPVNAYCSTYQPEQNMMWTFNQWGYFDCHSWFLNWNVCAGCDQWTQWSSNGPVAYSLWNGYQYYSALSNWQTAACCACGC